jgi:glutamate dehydrogenase/leucine dehydrogenase
MLAKGLEVMAAGANVPFNDPEIFYGRTLEHADNAVAVIPDFIANCGMARVFAYLMESDKKLVDKDIFEDTSNVIREALLRTHQVNPQKKRITSASLQLAIEEVMKPRF